MLTGEDGHAWVEAAEKVAAQNGVHGGRHRRRARLRRGDVRAAWTRSRGITRIGVALVRLDRYVAFRSAAAVDHPESVLRAALDAVLARSSA